MAQIYVPYGTGISLGIVHYGTFFFFTVNHILVNQELYLLFSFYKSQSFLNRYLVDLYNNLALTVFCILNFRNRSNLTLIVILAMTLLLMALALFLMALTAVKTAEKQSKSLSLWHKWHFSLWHWHFSLWLRLSPINKVNF